MPLPTVPENPESLKLSTAAAKSALAASNAVANVAKNVALNSKDMAVGFAKNAKDSAVGIGMSMIPPELLGLGAGIKGLFADKSKQDISTTNSNDGGEIAEHNSSQLEQINASLVLLTDGIITEEGRREAERRADDRNNLLLNEQKASNENKKKDDALAAAADSGGLFDWLKNSIFGNQVNGTKGLLGSLGAALAGFGGTLFSGINKFLIGPVLNLVKSITGPLLKSVGGGVAKLFKPLMSTVKSSFTLLKGFGSTAVKFIGKFLGPIIAIIDVVWDMFAGADKADDTEGINAGEGAIIGAIAGTGSGLSGAAVNALKGGGIGLMIAGPIGAAIGGVIGGILGFIGFDKIAGWWTDTKAAIVSSLGGVVDILGSVMDWVTGIFSSMWTGIKTFFFGTPEEKDPLSVSWTGDEEEKEGGILGTVMGWVTGYYKGIWSFFTGLFGFGDDKEADPESIGWGDDIEEEKSMLEMIQDKIGSIYKGIKDFILGMIPDVGDIASKGLDAVKGFFGFGGDDKPEPEPPKRKNQLSESQRAAQEAEYRALFAGKASGGGATVVAPNNARIVNNSATYMTPANSSNPKQNDPSAWNTSNW